MTAQVDHIDRYPVFDEIIAFAFPPVEIAQCQEFSGGRDAGVFSVAVGKGRVPDAAAGVGAFADKAHIAAAALDIEMSVAEAEEPIPLVKVFEFFEREAAADAAGAEPFHIAMPILVLFHAAHVAAIAIADVAHQAFAHRLDQLQALARLQRVLLGKQNAVFGDGTGNLAAVKTGRRRQHLITGLPHDREDVILDVALSDFTLAHHVELPEPDIGKLARGRDAEPIVDECAGEVAAAGDPLAAGFARPFRQARFDAAHEDVGSDFEVGEGMQQRQPEAGNEILNPDNLIDGRGAIPIDIIVDGGADGCGHVVNANVVELLPVVPDGIFVLLVQVVRHLFTSFRDIGVKCYGLSRRSPA